jgi:opacity protein-like surface antigen
MKKVLIASAIAATMASSLAFAQETAPAEGAFYVGVVTADTVLDDNAVALKGGYNYGLESLMAGLSLDSELTMSIVDAEQEFAFDTAEVSYWSAGSFARYTYGLDAIAPGLEVYGRAGLVYVDVELDSASTGTISDDSFEFGYGAGLSYQVASQVSVYADYTSITDLDEASVGVAYSF